MRCAAAIVSPANFDADAGEPTQHRYRQNDSDIELGRDAGAGQRKVAGHGARDLKPVAAPAGET